MRCVAESKTVLRIEARSLRAELARACPDFARRIAAFASELNIATRAVVAGYWPVRDEADPRVLMNALRTPLALPRIDTKDAALSFRAWREADALVDNRHGIPEPRAEAKIVTPDVVLVPLLAFDAHGHRLGYGGGYYDRTLSLLARSATPPAKPSLRALVTIGVAYAGQQVAALPREAHDRPLDMIVTENGLRRFTTRPE
ncbi:MAG TPA: 5-formyltetrahydrofolate cyclo-ligase [Rhizomicrobium sp.]